MDAITKFKYPIFISIVFALGFIVFATMVIGMIVSMIKKDEFLGVGMNLGDVVFGVCVNIFTPVFLMAIALIGLKRLRFAFSMIVFDGENKKIAIKSLKGYKEINFTEIISTKDFQNRGLLVLEGKYKTIVVPKEINGYFFLYGLLKENGLLKETIDFKTLKTTVGLFIYIVGFGMLTLSLMLLSMLSDLINNFDASSNSIMTLVLVSTLAIAMIVLVLQLANSYEFTDDGLIKKNLLYKTIIKYLSIESIDYDASLRTLIINLKDDKIKWLRELNGQKGIIIREPGNLSIEEMYFELEKRRLHAATS